MITGLYSAVRGIIASEANHEVIAHNLAHVDVPGFRRTVLPYQSYEPGQEADAAGDPQGVAAQAVATDFSAGGIQRTGRPLDLAINGDAFFGIDGPDGPLYTRNGVFQVNASGDLVTTDGRTVRGTNGPITIPPETPLSALTVRDDGVVQAGGIEIGQLQLVSFVDNQQLQRVGTTLFAAGDDAVPQPADATIVQGARELSNVQSVDELVRMIAGMRHYESSQRTLRALSDAIGHNTNPQTG